MNLADLNKKRLKELELTKMVLKNLVIYEMTLEDMGIWGEEFPKIYPSYVRFPETINWNRNLFAYRKDIIKDMQSKIKSCNLFINRNLNISSSKNYIKESSKFIRDRKLLLEEHLKGLRAMRDKRSKLK